jgi:hypothetical protein
MRNEVGVEKRKPLASTKTTSGDATCHLSIEIEE